MKNDEFMGATRLQLKNCQLSLDGINAKIDRVSEQLGYTSVTLKNKIEPQIRQLALQCIIYGLDLAEATGGKKLAECRKVFLDELNKL